MTALSRGGRAEKLRGRCDTRLMSPYSRLAWDPVSNRGWAVQTLGVAGEMDPSRLLSQDRQK